MVAKSLAHHYTPVTTANEPYHLVESAWAIVHAHAIQSICNSMHITAVIAAMFVLGTDFLGSMLPNFLEV